MNNYWTEGEGLDAFGDSDDIGEYDSESMDDYYAGEDYYSPEDYMSEDLAEYEPDMFDDSAELAEGLREVLHEDYQDASPEELQEALSNILETMTPAEGFSFKNILGKISKAGQSVLQNPTIAQVAGGTIGTALGGPGIGTAVGGNLAKAAAQALSGGGKPRSAPAPAPMATTSPTGAPAAATQLFQATQNKDVLASVVAAALGDYGKKAIPIGNTGQSVSVVEIMNLLRTLAGKAAEEAEELLGETTQMPAYLLDSEGNFRVDPAVPEDRAQALYQALLNAENQRLADEAALYSADAEFDDELDVDEYDEYDEEAIEDLLY